MKLISLFLLIICSTTLEAQELYWIAMENQFKKRSEYFPTHNISFQKEKAYLDNKLIFNSPMDMIYDYYYEIFVDVEKNKFLIIRINLFTKKFI